MVCDVRSMRRDGTGKQRCWSPDDDKEMIVVDNSSDLSSHRWSHLHCVRPAVQTRLNQQSKSQIGHKRSRLALTLSFVQPKPSPKKTSHYANEDEVGRARRINLKRTLHVVVDERDFVVGHEQLHHVRFDPATGRRHLCLCLAKS